MAATQCAHARSDTIYIPVSSICDELGDAYSSSSNTRYLSNLLRVFMQPNVSIEYRITTGAKHVATWLDCCLVPCYTTWYASRRSQPRPYPLLIRHTWYKFEQTIVRRVERRRYLTGNAAVKKTQITNTQRRGSLLICKETVLMGKKKNNFTLILRSIDIPKALIVQFVCRPRPARHTSTLNFSVLLCTKNIKTKHWNLYLRLIGLIRLHSPKP